jgi:hypothetical protein
MHLSPALSKLLQGTLPVIMTETADKTTAHALTLPIPPAAKHETSSPVDDANAPPHSPTAPAEAAAAPHELVPSPPTTPCNRTPPWRQQQLLSPNCSPSSSITAAAAQLTSEVCAKPTNSKRFAGRTILIVVSLFSLLNHAVLCCECVAVRDYVSMRCVNSSKQSSFPS